MAQPTGGLLRAVLLDGAGGGRSLDWAEVRAWKPGDGPIWAHLDRSNPEAQAWIRGEAGLDPAVREALVLEGSRPRVLPFASGALVILRGINHNPGSQRSDMVSLRMWVEAERVISLRVDRMLAPQLVAERVVEGRGAHSTTDLLIDVVRETSDLITPVINEIEDMVDEIEERMLSDAAANLRASLAELRREAISLRRFLGPQRDALQRLVTVEIPGAGPHFRLHVGEQSDRMTRFVEDLDAARERAVVASEELVSRQSDQLNRRMYVMAIITAIFLPLSLITGLLGINVGGMPGATDEQAFLFVTVGIVLLALLLTWLLKRLRWM